MPITDTAYKLYISRAHVTTYRVVKVSSSDRLLYRRDVVRVRITLNDNLYTFAQPSELVANIACPRQGLELQELLIAELLRVVGLGPLLPYVEQREVVAARPHEVLPRLVCVQLLVFRPVEQRAGFLEHRYDSQNLRTSHHEQRQLGKGGKGRYLVCALVVLAGDDRLRKHRVDGELGHPSAQLGQLASIVQSTQRIQQFECAHQGLSGWRVHELETDEVVDTK